MPDITLPDGSTLSFENPVSGAEIAAAIGPGLAKAALAVSVDGELWDLSRRIETDAAVSIVTAKDVAGLEVLRHGTAHLMAEAVKELYPDTQVTIGPAIENGFYYDFARAQPFTPDDLVTIEARMGEIVERDEEIAREVWPRDKAIEHFEQAGEIYKAEIIAGIPAGEDVTLYRQGDFLDLCRGPHLPSTGRIGAFKLTKIAGAYWRGNSDNEMLQRIYGTAWATEKDLKAHLNRLEEAEKRDHRRLGREMNLFHLQPEAMGMVFWHPQGWRLYRTLQTYMRRRLDDAGYVEVKTPELIDRSLWESSGHWEKFREHMFTTEAEDRVLALKPMNCPGHVQIFRQGIKSYRDLPLRMAEFGACHRYEPSGALHGLMRVRGFVQDDAHIFCSDDQITPETVDFCDLLMSIYRDFGFEQVVVNFADRPPVRVGADDVWDRAEGALLEAVKGTGLEVQHNPGEGAFYGPKLEFVLRDAIGRDWQCGTLQVDFVLPERLNASYVGEDGERHRPVMLHRAILGSLERFLGILIEHHAGRFPLWLAPRQVVVATITADSDAYAGEVVARLREAGLSAEADLRNEKIGYKVREHSVAKVPVILAVGGREAESQAVAMRRLGAKQQEILALDEAVDRLRQEAAGPPARTN
ncbi:MAG: threonine--tRNA ligase [Alphaproteobacteria bacterium]|jgi:threonyl-tRNA synthetase|nr:threonine--tRNA ligase [Alphaproteobacteria bacterium]MDP6590187.1 threonine--tRNA ligase [Alphaproteobacteria bacterium]MDP6819156.1 threonine--tRNA ligase [Alphaproteobacteria bacterium]|tara:strand:- start:1202 stop:3121 length:1920 start_codon:yes stop_codon:yes gene_type:complete